MQKQCSLRPLFPSASMDNSSPLTEAAHWLICSNGRGGFASDETLAAATWACEMVYVSRQEIYMTGGKAANVCDEEEVCIRVTCMCVLAWRARVCCVGGLIVESQGGGGGGEERDTWRKDGWGGGGDAVSSSVPTTSFTFFCTSGGKGVSVCLVSICMHEAIPLIHGISPSSTCWRMGDSIHIFMNADGFSVLLSSQFCLGISEG